MGLEEVFEEAKRRILDKEKGVLAILVFGSACRGEDFVPGLSDVDLLVVLAQMAERREELENIGGFRVSTIFLGREKLGELSNLGDPLAHWVEKDSKTIYCLDPEVSAWLGSLKPGVTQHTLKVFRWSSIAAYGISTNHYLLGDPIRVVHHLYHSLRHGVRYKTAKLFGEIPVSNDEIVFAMDKLGFNPKNFRELVEQRRNRRVSLLDADSLMEQVSVGLGAILDLELPSWEEVKPIFKGLKGGHVSYRIEGEKVRVTTSHPLRSTPIQRVS